MCEFALKDESADELGSESLHVSEEFQFECVSFCSLVCLVYLEGKSWWEGPSGCGSPFLVFELLSSD